MRSLLAAGAGLLLLTACARNYHAQGVVLSVDRPNREVTISHRPIAGYMDAMSMPFHVRTSSELDTLTPGSRVQFDVHVVHSATVVKNIRVRQPAVGDVPIPKAEGRVAIGEPMPDFTLTDQDGNAATLSSFRGQLVAVDFIYTRCPLPDVCPRLSANFARLQKRFGSKIVLLSVTLDPHYDTPAILNGYAHRWRADTHYWKFLTGSEEDVRKVAGRFGVVFWPEEGSITHTSSTALLDADSRLAALVEGSSFTSQQLIDLVEATAGRPSSGH